MTEIEKMFIDEGRKEQNKSASLRMLKKGFDYETIAEVQEVAIDQLKAWENEFFFHIIRDSNE